MRSPDHLYDKETDLLDQIKKDFLDSGIFYFREASTDLATITTEESTRSILNIESATYPIRDTEGRVEITFCRNYLVAPQLNHFIDTVATTVNGLVGVNEWNDVNDALSRCLHSTN